MHFSGTYAQLLASLPPDLQEYTIQYRQLKQVISQIVGELSSHGLNPTLLHGTFEYQDEQLGANSSRDSPDTSATASPSTSGRVSPNSIAIIGKHGFSRVVYELRENSDKIEPQLRMSGGYVRNQSENMDSSGMKGEMRELEGQQEKEGNQVAQDNLAMDSSRSGKTDERASPRGPGGLLLDFQNTSLMPQIPFDEGTQVELREVIIPLVWDSHFFELLCTTLDHMAAHLKSAECNFMQELRTLADEIGEATRPLSSRHSNLRRNFRLLSPSNHSGSTNSQPSATPSKSDLYSWREVFRLYIEADIFENKHPIDGGERRVEENERRLQLFADKVTQWSKDKFKLKQSYRILGAFLRLNISILNIKKLLLANSEATRELLRKRARRTALPFPQETSFLSGQAPPRLALISQVHSLHLPRALVQAIGGSLIPIIPHVDDYSCSICMGIAFKPIRLDCNHVFCVRCLVKMQKQGKDNCPMCRAPSVLAANRSNVDWALMNFIQDWFPNEVREKLKVDGKEINAEQLAELGYSQDVVGCVVM